jgi:hypothetical protein
MILWEPEPWSKIWINYVNCACAIHEEEMPDRAGRGQLLTNFLGSIDLKRQARFSSSTPYNTVVPFAEDNIYCKVRFDNQHKKLKSLFIFSNSLWRQIFLAAKIIYSTLFLSFEAKIVCVMRQDWISSLFIVNLSKALTSQKPITRSLAYRNSLTRLWCPFFVSYSRNEVRNKTGSGLFSF